MPETAKAAYGELLIRWEIWVLVLGCVLMITVPITMQTFAPLMYVQVFKYTPAQASKAASYFFLAQALMGLPAGCLADILRMRKALSFAMALTMAGLIAWWAGTFSHPLSLAGLGTVNLLVGGLWSLTYIPWAAFYSEYLKDVAPALQATGWSFLQIVFRFWLASAVFLQPIVAQHFGWVTWIWLWRWGCWCLRGFLDCCSGILGPHHEDRRPKSSGSPRLRAGGEMRCYLRIALHLGHGRRAFNFLEFRD